MSLPVMSSPDFTPVGSSAEAAAGPGSSVPISVVLADDHKVLRSGLRVLLQSDGRFEVLGEAGSVAGTIDTVLACRPRVLVLDLNMAGESSLEARGCAPRSLRLRSWC
jgi:AmiR/NasT family two-component response regulator